MKKIVAIIKEGQFTLDCYPVEEWAVDSKECHKIQSNIHNNVVTLIAYCNDESEDILKRDMLMSIKKVSKKINPKWWKRWLKN